MNADQRIGHERRHTDGSEQDRLRSIVDHVAEGIVIVSEEGVIRFANPSAQRLFGLQSPELIGRDLGFPVVAGENAEVEVVQPHQHSVTAELRAVDLDWEGAPAHLISLRDVSDRKHAEERARELERERLARAEAEAANRAKSEFLALMSHELRTPLNAVIGYADLLELGLAGPLSSQQRHQISRIAVSGRHLLGLVNEVLDLARVEAGRLTLRRGIAPSQATVEAALTLVRPIADGLGVALSVHAASEMEASYEGDEDRVRQILVNLVNNAVKFTPSGGNVTVSWGVTTHSDEQARLTGTGPWCFFRVQDNGLGIPADKLLTIFEPFVQVEEGHTRSREGSGLGLTISRRLARLMSGDLTVRSELGKGSAFTLWLPQARVGPGDVGRRRREVDPAQRFQGLEDVAKTILRELDSVLDAFVHRMREEPRVESARMVRDCQITNHLAEYVVGLAGTLSALEDAQRWPSDVVAERAKLQTLITDEHGTQRARLGWTASLLRKEWLVLREEIERVIRLHGRELPESSVAEAMLVIGRAIDAAIDESAHALFRASASEIQ